MAQQVWTHVYAVFGLGGAAFLLFWPALAFRKFVLPFYMIGVVAGGILYGVLVTRHPAPLVTAPLIALAVFLAVRREGLCGGCRSVTVAEGLGRPERCAACGGELPDELEL